MSIGKWCSNDIFGAAIKNNISYVDHQPLQWEEEEKHERYVMRIAAENFNGRRAHRRYIPIQARS